MFEGKQRPQQKTFIEFPAGAEGISDLKATEKLKM